MSAPYCARCIETWAIKGTETVTLGHWVDAIPGLFLHVTCGRALEAIRTAPATYESEPMARWAA